MKQTKRFLAYAVLFCMASSFLVADWPSYPTSVYTRTLLVLTNQGAWQAALGIGGGSGSSTNGSFYNLTVTNNILIPENGAAGGTNFTPTLFVNDQVFYGLGNIAYTNGDQTNVAWVETWTSTGWQIFNKTNPSVASFGISSIDGTLSSGGPLEGSAPGNNVGLSVFFESTVFEVSGGSDSNSGHPSVSIVVVDGGDPVITFDTQLNSQSNYFQQYGDYFGATNLQSANIVATNDFNTAAVVLNTLYTNSSRTAVWYLDMSLTDAVGGTPALTVTVNQGPVTNTFVRSPLVVGVGGTVTNGWAFPLNAGAIYKVQDTSSGTGASVAVKQSVVTKN